YAPFLSKLAYHPLGLTHRGGSICGCYGRTVPNHLQLLARYTPLCLKQKYR
ncbi:hypothetical protein D030_2022B, partial [Vibrio parahaemolyticus AQ3810]